MTRIDAVRPPLPACMGGWCTKRDHCPHHASEARDEPAERLCIPGQDGTGIDHAIRIHRPAGTWELSRVAASHVAPATAFPEAA